MPDLKMELKCSQSDNRGIYYAETKRAMIYLAMHESLDDLYKTIDHETYHHCFNENGETDGMDEHMEERVIYCLQWARFDLI